VCTPPDLLLSCWPCTVLRDQQLPAPNTVQTHNHPVSHLCTALAQLGAQAAGLRQHLVPLPVRCRQRSTQPPVQRRGAADCLNACAVGCAVAAATTAAAAAADASAAIGKRGGGGPPLQCPAAHPEASCCEARVTVAQGSCACCSRLQLRRLAVMLIRRPCSLHPGDPAAAATPPVSVPTGTPTGAGAAAAHLRCCCRSRDRRPALRRLRT